MLLSSTLPEQDVNRILLRAVREHGFTGKIAVALCGTENERLLADGGVDHVFRPYDNAADFAAEEITHALMRQSTKTQGVIMKLKRILAATDFSPRAEQVIERATLLVAK